VNWAPSRPDAVGLNLVNKTRYALHVEAHKITEADGRGLDRLTAIQVVVTSAPHHVDPLEKELAETKAVLGDLLQEKLVGVKVYVLHWKSTAFGREPLPHAYLSVDAAKKAAANREGTTHIWVEGPSSRSHGAWWEVGPYLITEHEVSS
jgi:hypothetical protein